MTRAVKSQSRAACWAPCLVLLVLLVGGCAANRETRPQGAWLDDRSAWLDAHPRWSLKGRLGLSDGERGGTLAFDWSAEGDRHQVHLRTLAGGRQWRLEFGPGGALLSGTDMDPQSGPDADLLVREATGWPIPVRWMTHWLLGLPAPERAALNFAEDGTLAALAVDDWTLDFNRFAVPPGYSVLMPARIEARLPPYRIRAALTGWSFRAPESATAGRAVRVEPL